MDFEKRILRSAYPTYVNVSGAPSCSAQDDTRLGGDCQWRWSVFGWGFGDGES